MEVFLILHFNQLTASSAKASMITIQCTCFSVAFP
jgi:hypothetical protein